MYYGLRPDRGAIQIADDRVVLAVWLPMRKMGLDMRLR
ncbi:hypothetical protein EV286_116110 [Rhizobium sp. BK251]|nr:hypothetical protein EV286_116110 [Rhizobium sp. BK251]